ncbi:L domain-like protein [Hyphopichia burtonii NRRL Y-1933]|uniref:L domain-like protein n=1 Tax=Hyphopichia burtonii NRRL Y-1933 TaxID=984485 RepID=A0A1E4RSI1_9ASCO|nr:L domain-like protein [Hyphopichia burtonii NRRL Y-1933]ODV70239.1 L domain-like protein [Hyphopichia burtonii NRRL Y-1933]
MSFLTRYFPNLPDDIIVEICDQLPKEYLFEFLLYLKETNIRSLIIEKYFNNELHFILSPTRRSHSCYDSLVDIHGFALIEEFLDNNPDINPRLIKIITGGDFRSLENLVLQYNQRFNGQVDKIHLQIENYELDSDDFIFLINNLSNITRIQLSGIKLTKILKNLKQNQLANLKNCKELVLLGHGINDWSNIQLPPLLNHLDLSWRSTCDVTTITLSNSIEHIYWNQAGINSDVLTKINFPNNLKTLMLTYNNLLTIDLKDLPPSLETLDLSYNVLTNFIIDDNSQWPVNLNTLILSSNHLTNGSLTNLSKIDWPSNMKNFKIDENPFDSLVDLKLPMNLDYLNILNNNLKNLLVMDYNNPSDSYPFFQFPVWLDSLDLSNSDFNYTNFNDPTKRIRFPDTLTSLNLSECNIYHLNHFIFPISLKKLSLTGNKISDLNDYNDTHVNWGKMINLAELELYFNEIDALANWICPPNLKILDLRLNKLSQLTPSYPMFNPNDAFTNLKTLKIDENQINFIDPNCKLPKNLLHLSLETNLIENFPFSNGFIDSNLHYLNLKNNLINNIDFHDGSHSSLIQIDLTANNLLKSLQTKNLFHEWYDQLEACLGKKISQRKRNINRQLDFI